MREYRNKEKREEGPHDNSIELLSESFGSGVVTLKEGVVLTDNAVLHSFSMELHCIIYLLWRGRWVGRRAAQFHDGS